ncbi:MAG: class I SAM-dependent methyltransferase [Armatimonadetes bacterium]|nr:class I SAM-dependent methyltransferase [Armatimonadota bacterium]
MLYYRLHHDPKSSHQQISSAVRRLKRQPILDVGSAQGFLGQLLEGSGLDVDAIEPNPECAQFARPFYRHIFHSTVEETALPPATYRAVVCGDVLEHLRDPAAVLDKLHCATTDDAVFIVSLPNVAHIAVRLMLLAGFFPHMERGILDRTHLHFYTLDTARALLEGAGLQVTRATPTGVPLDELFPQLQNRAAFKILMKAQHILLRLAPRVFGFQWILVARKRQGAK